MSGCWRINTHYQLSSATSEVDPFWCPSTEVDLFCCDEDSGDGREDNGRGLYCNLRDLRDGNRATRRQPGVYVNCFCVRVSNGLSCGIELNSHIVLLEHGFLLVLFV